MKTQIIKKPLVAAIAACALGSAALPAVAADDAMMKRMEMLERELQALKASMQKKEEVQLKKGVELKKGTRFQYGGFIKADALWTDTEEGERPGTSVGNDFLVPSTIPVGNGSDGDAVFDAHAKNSRFWLKTTTETEVGDLVSYVEMDFNQGGVDERLTNQASNGLRHAFVRWDYEPGSSLLAGQTWSTFFNTGALPEAVDFVGPTSGTVFNRQVQVRWTKGLGNGTSFMLSAENPASVTTNLATNTTHDDNARPDIVARYNGKAGNLSYSVAAMSREIAFDDNAGNDDSFNGTAISVAGKYAFANGNDIKFMFNSGNTGRYVGLGVFTDGVTDLTDDIDEIDVNSGFIAYKHKWNSRLRSTFSYAFATADNPSGADTLTEKISNANINLLYSPTNKLTFGAEYIKAERELENGDDGELTRLQFMTKYAF